MSKKGHSLRKICEIAFAYVGTVVGAGFASGQEVMRFFTLYGRGSVLAIAISALLFIWVGKQVLLLGRELQAASISGINKKVFGAFSPIVTGYLIFTMVVICTAMLAGSGALFQEYGGFDSRIGILVTGIATLIVMFFGVKGIMSANFAIVPILIFFNILICAFTFFGQDASNREIGYISGTMWDVFKSGVSYASFNLVLSAGVLAPMGREIDDSKVLAAGGILGGAILGFLLVGSNYCLWVHVPLIYNYEIPTLFIIRDMGSIFSKLYVIVLWSSIYTTLIGNLFTIASIIYEKTNISPMLTSVIVMVGGYFLSSFGFSGIVSNLYPPLGLIGILFMAMIIFASLNRTEYIK